MINMKDLIKKQGDMIRKETGMVKEKKLNEDMAKDLEQMLKSKGGISLWNMDMKNMNWTHSGPERKYKKLYKKFIDTYGDLLKFVKEADKKGWF